MRLLDLDDRYSLIQYINEDCVSSYKMKANMERIDEQFFKPWARYLEEQQLTADQINKIFTAAHKEAQASGANSTMLGKIVEKIIPDSMLQKLSDSLPEPDPNAANDPQFANKAGAAVNQLPVDAETKGGLMKMVANAAKNPAVQPMVLALVGGVLGGLVQKVGPMLSATGVPGTLIAGVAGAVVAGGVAVAAAKIQGKSWKEAFKGAIKPALAGAAGAVIGKMAAEFIGSIGTGGGDAGAQAADNPEMQNAMAADERMMDRLTSKYPPDKYEYMGSGGDRLIVYDKATGEPVFTGGIQPRTMDVNTFADLANQGKTVQPQTFVGTGNQVGSGSKALDDFLGGPEKYDQMQTMLSTQEKAAIGQDVAKQMGLAGDNVKFQGNVPVSVDGQPVPQNIQQSYGGAAAGGPTSDPTGMGAASDYKPVNTGSLRQGGAPGGVAFPGDPGYVPPEQAGQIKPVWRNKTRMPQTFDSREYLGNRLSEGQCYLVMKRVAATKRNMILEGHLIVEAGLLQKAGTWLKTKAQNVTQQVTADKLMQAWKSAGSPTDSNAVADIMTKAGVNADVIKKVYTDMQIPEPGKEGTADQVDFKTLSDQIMKMSVDTKVQIVNYMKNELKVA